jgi:hypothetical protein
MWLSAYGIAQIATSSNALDRINFGDTGTDAYSESTHSFVNMGNPTGTGALGLTYREIAPSVTTANIGNPADNEVLTFTMTCSSTKQNYLTIQLWGSDITPDVIYLYTASQGYQVSNYYSTDAPELDFQESDPILPGRFVYETVPIPLSMTTGKTSVTLTLNAAESYYYYNNTTTNLATGQTSRPIYAAFTHTQPYLGVNSTDVQGTAPTATTATPATLNSSYLSSLVSEMSSQVQNVLNNQLFGSSWSAAVTAGTVPAQIYGYFDAGKSPSNSYTVAEWLNNAAIDTSSGNNVSMERLDMLAYAYVTPGLLTAYYQNANVEKAIVAALDSYSYMQALNGCWGDMTAWDGVGATAASTSNPYGRANAQCSPIEGNGTWALGSAIALMQNDATFLSDLNQPISSTLEPGITRYVAYQTMLVNNMTFLNSSIGPGHAPNQDLLQARSYLFSNIALQALDKIYSTSYALTNAAMMPYLNVAAGLATDAYGGIWISADGLGLELNGTGNGSYDGGYGLNDMNDMVMLAKYLEDYGIETASNHPIRTVAINGLHSFSNFIYPSLVIDGSGYATTVREEETITFRKNLDVGEIYTGSNYYAAVQFNDPYAIHAFYLEYANGLTWSIPAFAGGHFDDTMDAYLREFADYATLCNMVNTESDPSGIYFLDEPAHANGVWADPTASTIAIKHNGEVLDMVLNWRPLQVPGEDNKPSASDEIVNNIARVHDTTATTDRIATVMMPTSTATGSSGSYTSGSYGTLYVGRYGSYLVGLNWLSAANTLTLASDMTSGTATDLVSGANYDLTLTTSVPVPASGAVALYQTMPTATLSSAAISFGSITADTTSSQTVTLSNTGTGPLLISSFSLGGTNASSFLYTTTCSNSLAINSSCTFTFTFTPMSIGSLSASLSLTTCLSTTAQTISLSGTGASITTATALVASPTATVSGEEVTLTATVVPAFGTVTGNVTFNDGSTVLGSASLNASGIAIFSTASLPTGSDSLTASYAATGLFGASTSSAVSVTVSAAGAGGLAALTFTPSVIATIAGTGASGYSGDNNIATNALVTNGIRGIMADSSGDVFFVDDSSYTVRVIYEGGATASALITAENPTVTIPVAGNIYVLAGTEGTSGTPVVGLATSEKFKPGAALGLDAAGDIYLNDTGTNKIWEIYAGGATGARYISLDAGVSSPVLGYVYAVAGGGSSGYGGDGDLATNSAVELHGVNDVKFDSNGNMYIVDQGNNRVREVSASNGYISTIIGNGTQGSTGDGAAATSAELNTPYEVAIDAANNIYIVDHGSPDVRVIYEGGTLASSLITLENPTVNTPSTGYVYQIGGGGATAPPYTGSILASAGKISSPTGIAIDSYGNLYVAGNGQNVVQEINASTGYITDIAGNATAGYSGDGGAATSAELQGLRNVGVDTSGRVYITDATNLRVRQVGPQGSLVFATAQGVGLTSTASTITLTNVGSSALTFSGTPSFGGANAGDFALATSSSSNTCTLTTLAAGASCNLAITFTPTSAGARTAMLTVTTNGVLPSQTVIVSGTALPASTTALTTSSTSVIAGQSVTFTATVIGVSPTGTVSFYNAGTNIGTATLNSNIATLSYTTSASGTLSVTATYVGDANNGGSTSSAVVVAVTGSSTSSTSLAASATAIQQGSSLSLTATVSGSKATPTGSVAFYNGTTALGTSLLNTSGVATLAITSLTSGQCSITAQYSGDAIYSASVSSASTVHVTGTPMIVLTASSTNYIYGSSVTLTATLSYSGVTPTGTIAFYDGSTELGTGALSSGVVTYSTTILTGGTHTITASYLGSTYYNAVTSAATTVTVSQASSANALSSSSSTTTYGSSITLTATVTSTVGTPTGTVTFFCGSTSLGSSALNGSGVATLAIVLPFGADSLTASYGGSANLTTSTSTAINVTVSAGVTATAISSSSSTLPFGQEVTLTATVTSALGMPAGTVTFYEGTTSLGSATLNSSGIATLSTANLAVGTDSLTASYSGSTTYSTSTSSALSITVSSAGTGGLPALTFTPSLIATIAGTGVTGDTGDGSVATSAEVSSGIRGIAADSSGDVFIVDTTNQTVRVIYNGGSAAASLIAAEDAVNSPVIGNIYLIAGWEGVAGTPTSGAQASSSEFHLGTALYLDSAGDVYIADNSVHEVFVIYNGGTQAANLINLEDGVAAPVEGCIYTLAGNGTSGETNDGGTVLASASELDVVDQVALDGSGNLYMLDNAENTLREVSAATGYISLVTGTAGSAGSTGNKGVASSALLNAPYGFALDAYGNIFIADKGNNQIREIYEGNGTAAAKMIANYSGNPTTPVAGDIYEVAGTSEPTWLALDSYGNIYIASNGYSTIQELTTATSTLTLVAGVTSTACSSPTATCGDGGAATSANLAGVRDAAVDTAGRVYITDATDMRIRQVGPQGVLTFTTSVNAGSTSAVSTITLNNVGASTLIFNGAPSFSGTNPADFALDTGSSSNTCTLTTLAAGTSCKLAITFSPLAAGARTATLTIPTNGVLGTQTAILSGAGLSANTSTVLTSSATSVSVGRSLTFTATVTGASPTGTVTFYNSGTSIGTGTVSSRVVTLSYTTIATGTLSVTATYGGDTNNGSSTSSAVTVTVTPAASVSLSSSATSIVPGQGVTLTATVSSTGVTPTGTVTFSAASTGATQGTLGTTTLSNGVATYYGLVWGGTDSITAIYSGDSNYGSSSSNVVTVSNYPVIGKLGFNWPYVNWGQAVSYGASSSVWPVTLQNLTGTTVASPVFGFSGTGAANFSVTSNTCTAPLPQGATCTFNLVFTPTTGGAAAGATTSATLTASTSTSASYSNTLSVSGIAVSGSLQFNWPFLNFTPTVPVGTTSSAWPVALTNSSATSTTLQSPAVTFSDASFAMSSDSCSGQTLASGASCTYSVVFTPLAADVTTGGTNVISGTMTASGNSGAITGSLNVSGWAASALAFNWPFATFQSQAQGTTGTNPWPVTVTNYSGQALSGLSYTFTGVTNYVSGAFTLTNTCSTLAAGASCTFDILPSPLSGQTVGAYSAALVVSGNGYSSYPFTVSGVVGVGGFSINWNQDQQAGVSTIDFGPQNTKNVTAGPWPITVYNNTSSMQAMTLSPSLSVFTAGDSTCSDVASLSECSFNLYFTPTSDTSYTGTLTITGSAGGSYTFNTWGGANK